MNPDREDFGAAIDVIDWIKPLEEDFPDVIEALRMVRHVLVDYSQ